MHLGSSSLTCLAGSQCASSVTWGLLGCGFTLFLQRPDWQLRVQAAILSEEQRFFAFGAPFPFRLRFSSGSCSRVNRGHPTNLRCVCPIGMWLGTQMMPPWSCLPAHCKEQSPFPPSLSLLPAYSTVLSLQHLLLLDTFYV